MATIDDTLIVKNILSTNWVAANVNNTTPIFYFDDSIKNHDYRTDAVKVYQRSLTRKVQDVTYGYHEIRAGISIDIRCSNRDRMLLLRDEVNRCLNSVRKAPDSNYDLILFDGERQVTGYSNFWHYVIDITLRNNGKVIPT